MSAVKKNKSLPNLSLVSSEDRVFMAEVLRSVIPQYEPIMPGGFQKWSNQIESAPLPDFIKTELILNEKQKLGFIATVRITEGIHYLMMLYFLPAHQRLGYGKTVLNSLYDRLKREGQHELILLVNQQADWAIDFYQKNGFKIIAREQNAIEAYCDSKMKPFFVPGTLLMGKTIF